MRSRWIQPCLCSCPSLCAPSPNSAHARHGDNPTLTNKKRNSLLQGGVGWNSAAYLSSPLLFRAEASLWYYKSAKTVPPFAPPYFPAGSARGGRKPVADPGGKRQGASQQREAREISRSHQTAFRSSSTLFAERSRADRAGLRGAGDIVAALAEPLVKCQPA